MLANTLISLLIVHWDSSFSDLVRVSMIKSKFGDANSVKGMMCKHVFRNLNSTFQTFPEIWLLSLPQTNYNLFLLAFQKVFLKKKISTENHHKPEQHGHPGSAQRSGSLISQFLVAGLKHG